MENAKTTVELGLVYWGSRTGGDMQRWDVTWGSESV